MRDALVGRDILLGVALSTLLILCWAQLHVIIPHVFELNAPPPPHPYPMGSMRYFFFLNAPFSRAMFGGRYVLETVAAAALGALALTLLLTIFVLGLRLVLRRTWAVLTIYFAFAAALGWPTSSSGPTAIAIGLSLAGGAVFLWALRFGFLGVLSLMFSLNLWSNFPVTGNMEAPFFETGLVAVLIMAGLAAYGGSPHRAFERPLPQRCPSRLDARNSHCGLSPSHAFKLPRPRIRGTLNVGRGVSRITSSSTGCSDTPPSSAGRRAPVRRSVRRRAASAHRRR
jgi:hypothetical protein